MKTLPMPMSHVMERPAMADRTVQDKDGGRKDFASHVETSKPPVNARPGSDVASRTEHVQPPSPVEEGMPQVVAFPSAPYSPVHTEAGALYPLKLAVVGYLSMLRIEGSDEARTPLAADASSSIEGSVQHVAGAPIGVDVAAGPVMTEESTGLPVASLAVHGATEDDERIATVAVVPDLPTDATRWQRRRLSLANGDRGVTLRLRDFGMDAEASMDASQALRDQARKAGLKLARIMVNGKETWAVSSGDIITKREEA